MKNSEIRKNTFCARDSELRRETNLMSLKSVYRSSTFFFLYFSSSAAFGSSISWLHFNDVNFWFPLLDTVMTVAPHHLACVKCWASSNDLGRVSVFVEAFITHWKNESSVAENLNIHTNFFIYGGLSSDKPVHPDSDLILVGSFHWRHKSSARFQLFWYSNNIVIAKFYL